MPLDLPYFKFIPTEWLTGNICCEDLETQGLFINLCALYWQRSGILTVDDVEKRYKKPFALQSLLSGYCLVTDGKISIKFLDEQLQQFAHKSTVNAENGRKGGRPKSNTDADLTKRKPKKTERLAKKSHIEIEEEIKIKVYNKVREVGFNTELFANKWLEWRRYKKNEHRFTYKTDESELAALEALFKLSGSDEIAITIIDQSISNGWKGFFAIKNKINGTNTNRTGKPQLTADVAAAWLNLGRK